ncbi:MAG: tRNA lysidine(34) synthetase TilS [Betaproteobacteria bacterium]|nr:tRNA lysidine(34) synthetase TilS [Betaproteobacteria bacterium]
MAGTKKRKRSSADTADAGARGAFNPRSLRVAGREGRLAVRIPSPNVADPLEVVARFLGTFSDLRGARLAVGLSGGIDSVVLLHLLRTLSPEFGYVLSAVHVHHGISTHADRWARFAARLCRAWRVPLVTRRVTARRRGRGVEGGARDARYEAYARLNVDALALAHHLDDQAETVLLNLLRGSGVRGASGMRAVTPLRDSRGGEIRLLRPLLDLPREAIVSYAAERELDWVEDESNRDVALARNFLRWRVAPLLAERFPEWRKLLARAATHFAEADEELRHRAASAERLSVRALRESSPAAARLRLREFLAAFRLRPPHARKLADMLRQVVGAARDTRLAIEHDGAVLRVYRGVLMLTPRAASRVDSVAWRGERRLELPGYGGELRFRRTRGAGIDARLLALGEFAVRPRSGGERLQPEASRPRRSLKNLFQEQAVPPWEREQMPLLFQGARLAWVPNIGVDVSFCAPPGAIGWTPQWHRD